jgi:hypothetical protein
MHDWGYKANGKKLDKHGTLLLLERGFLCRSAHDDSGNAAANVSDVQLGDVVHCYYSHAGKHDSLGAFQVVEKAEAPRVAGRLASQFPGTVLYEASDPSFIQELDPKGGYAPDSNLGVFMGWAVKRVGHARPYDPKAFPGQRTLVRLP